jgi:hypothetical protein
MAHDGLDRVRARRVFEDCIAIAQQQYALTEDAMVEAKALNAAGERVVVARYSYKLYTDGRMECFEVLDDVLWPDA